MAHEQLMAKLNASIATYTRLVMHDAPDAELDKWRRIIARNREAVRNAEED